MNEGFYNDMRHPTEPCLIEDQVTGGRFLSVSFIGGNEDLLVSTFETGKFLPTLVRIRSCAGGTRYQTGDLTLHGSLFSLKDVFEQYAQPNIFQGSFRFSEAISDLVPSDRPEFIIVHDDKNSGDWEIPYLSFYRTENFIGIRSSEQLKDFNEKQEVFFKYDHSPIVWLDPRNISADCSGALINFYNEARKYKRASEDLGMMYE